MCLGLNVKYQFLFSNFNETWIFPQIFEKYWSVWNFVKIHPVGAELFYATTQTYRQTDMTKLIVAFYNFGNAPDNGRMCSLRNHTKILHHLSWLTCHLDDSGCN